MDKTFSFLAVTLTILALIIFVADFNLIHTEKSKVCEKKYLFQYENNEFYSDCLDNIQIEDKSDLYEVKAFIEEKGLRELYKKADKKVVSRDGTKSTYYYNDIVLISCNTKNENKDLNTKFVFGTVGLTPEDACK